MEGGRARGWTSKLERVTSARDALLFSGSVRFFLQEILILTSEEPRKGSERHQEQGPHLDLGQAPPAAQVGGGLPGGAVVFS